jgi:hypothetical protein
LVRNWVTMKRIWVTMKRIWVTQTWTATPVNNFYCIYRYNKFPW